LIHRSRELLRSLGRRSTSIWRTARHKHQAQPQAQAGSSASIAWAGMAEPVADRGSDKVSDSETLALLGKKQVLKRRFGFWSIFGFACCELITWETVLALFSQGFNNGGPAGLVY